MYYDRGTISAAVWLSRENRMCSGHNNKSYTVIYDIYDISS